MKCKYCFKTLRKCKRIDFVDRDYHFSCEELERKMKYEIELENFIRWFKLKGINILI